MDGWCWGWRGGVADYWGTKNKKGKSKNQHRGEDTGTKSGIKHYGRKGLTICHTGEIV